MNMWQQDDDCNLWSPAAQTQRRRSAHTGVAAANAFALI